MANFNTFAGLDGTFTGTSSLWLNPSTPVAHSVSVAELTTVARGGGLMLTYNWDEGGPQDGLILFSRDPDSEDAVAAYVDSFHTGGRMMLFRGDAAQDGPINVLGSYGAVPGPAWGWRIVLSPDPSAGFTLTMFNITPASEESKGFEVDYQRISPID